MTEEMVSTALPERDDADTEAPRESEVTVLIKELKARIAAHTGGGEPPERLLIAEIKTLPELFQPRGTGGTDERHVSELRRGLKVSKVLDPVTVIWIGDEAILIDGHHRLAAYLAEKHFGEIPIQTFKGTVEDAVLEAGRANSRAKLPMGVQQRNDYAWRLVVIDSYSKAKIVEAAGVSDGQVAAMRRVRKALGADAGEFKSWWEAQAKAKGITREALTEEEQEQRLEDLANTYADKMAKAFTTKLANNPEVAARTLAIYFGRNLGEVWRELKEHLDPDHDPDGHYDPTADF